MRANFEAKYRIAASGCWLWMAGKTECDYGRFRCPPDTKAHRAAWRMYVGRIPRNRHVLHRCDVPACVNPDHLFLGTQLNNQRDMAAKERSGMTRLSWKKVARIRSREGLASSIALGEKFGVTPDHIRRIWANERWKIDAYGAPLT